MIVRNVWGESPLTVSRVWPLESAHPCIEVLSRRQHELNELAGGKTLERVAGTIQERLRYKTDWEARSVVVVDLSSRRTDKISLSLWPSRVDGRLVGGSWSNLVIGYE